MTGPLLVPERHLLARPLAAAGIDPAASYIVGGAVRDALLGRPTIDLDLIVTDDPAKAARALARQLGTAVFALSERHGAWRVVRAGSGRPGIDVSPVTGGSVEADLRRRDFTVNALAVRLADGELVDVLGGRSALDEGRLAAASATAFTSDPLRLVRLARFVAELGFVVDEGTLALAAAAAPLVDEAAGERVSIELRRALAGNAGRALQVLDRTGVGARLVPGRTRPLAAAGPSIAALRGAADTEATMPPELEPELARRLDEATDVRAALRLAALLVDGGSPAGLVRRLRLSRSTRTIVVRSVAAVVGGSPPAGGEALLGWLRSAAPAGLAALALTIARDPSLGARASIALTLLAPGPPLVTGRDLRRLGVVPGPRLGELLRAIRDEQALGRIATREEALAIARRLASSRGDGADQTF